METHSLFSERQRFNQWWIWLLVVALSVMPVFELVRRITAHQLSISDPAMLVETFIPFVLLLLIFNLRLDTKITKEGVSVRFIPFIWKYRHYSFETIDKLYLRQYKPIGEYGGWGLRGFGNNRALNIAGNKGVQIVFADGRRLLIGTQKPEEIKAVLIMLDKFKEE